VALAVCLLLDERAEAVVRDLWHRLEAAGVPTLLSHTHGRHRPHLTYASLRTTDPVTAEDVVATLTALPQAPPTVLHLDGFGSFRRSRCWLAPAVSGELVERQHAVIEALRTVGAELHRHYLPGHWVPHVTVAPRLHLRELPLVAGHVYDVLPVRAVLERAAVIDTSTGEVHALPHLV
jgi:2'-5' RNA ligase